MTQLLSLWNRNVLLIISLAAKPAVAAPLFEPAAFLTRPRQPLPQTAPHDPTAFTLESQRVAHNFPRRETGADARQSTHVLAILRTRIPNAEMTHERQALV